MMKTPGTNEIAHEPTQAFVESMDLSGFIREYGIDDYDELIERTTTEVDGVPESGLQVF